MARKFLIFDGKREWWLDRFDMVVVASLLSSLVLAGQAQQGLFPATPSMSPQDVQLDASAITVAVLLALYVVMMPVLAFVGSFMKARAGQPLAARVYSVTTVVVLALVVLQSWTHVSFGKGLEQLLASRYADQGVEALWSGYEAGRIPEQAYFQACQEVVETAIAANLEPVQCINPLMPAMRLELEPSEAGLKMARYRLDIQDNLLLARQLLWMQAGIALLALLFGLLAIRKATRSARRRAEQQQAASEKPATDN